MHSFATWMIVAAVGLACACGGGDDDDGASDGSGVDADTLLAELTDAQAQSLCRFDERVYKDSLASEDDYCVAEGASGATSSEECEQWRQECLESGSFDDDVDEDWECEDETGEDFVAEGSDCTVTVGQYEDCVLARARERSEYMASASCEAEGSFAGVQDPAACAALEACQGGGP